MNQPVGYIPCRFARSLQRLHTLGLQSHRCDVTRPAPPADSREIWFLPGGDRLAATAVQLLMPADRRPGYASRPSGGMVSS
jgi:hypothetical protein